MRACSGWKHIQSRRARFGRCFLTPLFTEIIQLARPYKYGSTAIDWGFGTRPSCRTIGPARRYWAIIHLGLSISRGHHLLQSGRDRSVGAGNSAYFQCMSRGGNAGAAYSGRTRRSVVRVFFLSILPRQHFFMDDYPRNYPRTNNDLAAQRADHHSQSHGRPHRHHFRRHNHIAKLKKAGRIRHVGPTNKGRWEILGDYEE